MRLIEPFQLPAPRSGTPPPVAGERWALRSKETVEHQIAEVLREKIIVGHLARGQKLKQADLARMLGVSITPVREALRLLEAQGYVSVSAHRGALVAPFLVDGAEELFQLRLTLETRLTREAAKRLTPADLSGLKALNHDVLTAVKMETRAVLQATNFRFHFRFYELAEQPQTLDFVRVLWAKYPLDLLSQMPGRPMRVFEEHVVLLAALESGDPETAVRAMREHIETGWREFLANYRSEQA
jgi:DNA-binding GntR family transcriptional regulator